ncbi:helix-turn-helix domain-containing protein [Parapedobacter deserti]
MQLPFRLHIASHYPHANESQRLPADCSYRIAYATARCWRGDGWWVAEQWHDARHAYPYLIEVYTTKRLRFTVECLREDLHWLYTMAGAFRLGRQTNADHLWLYADEHTQVLATEGHYEIQLESGRHLLFGFVVEQGWPRRYAATSLAYLYAFERDGGRTCRSTPHLPITPAMRAQLLSLATIPPQEGMVQDAAIYRPVAQLTQLTRDAHEGAGAHAARSFQLAQAVRGYLRDAAKNAGRPPAITQLAAHFHVTPDYLSRVHRMHYGQNLQSYLMRLRLNEAFRLLTEEGLTASAVAYRLEFTDLSAFGKLFRKQFKKTPSSVRKKHRY